MGLVPLLASSPIACAYRVMVDANDVTDKWRAEKRVLEIDVDDREGEASDSCTITLDDTAPHIAWPPEGALLRLWLGASADELVDMGTYTLDAPEASAPPSRLIVKGHAANFLATGGKVPMQAHRSRTWSVITLANMAQTIALDHGLIARVQPTLAAQLLDPMEQVDQGDLEFFAAVCKRYGARARVKAAEGTLGGALEVVGAGSQLPDLVLLGPGDVENWSAPFGSRSKPGAVVANWHNPKTGGSGVAHAGNGDPRIVLTEVFESASAASSAAKSLHKDKEREAAQLSLTLTVMNTGIASGTAISLAGFRSEIDTIWNCVQVRHHADAFRPRTMIVAERAV